MQCSKGPLFSQLGNMLWNFTLEVCQKSHNPSAGFYVLFCPMRYLIWPNSILSHMAHNCWKLCCWSWPARNSCLLPERTGCVLELSHPSWCSFDQCKLVCLYASTLSLSLFSLCCDVKMEDHQGHSAWAVITNVECKGRCLLWAHLFHFPLKTAPQKPLVIEKPEGFIPFLSSLGDRQLNAEWRVLQLLRFTKRGWKPNVSYFGMWGFWV